MSIGSSIVKIGLEESGPVQLLENIHTQGTVSYTLGTTGEDVPSVSAGPVLDALRANEPDKNVMVLPQ